MNQRFYTVSDTDLLLRVNKTKIERVSEIVMFHGIYCTVKFVIYRRIHNGNALFILCYEKREIIEISRLTMHTRHFLQSSINIAVKALEGLTVQ